MNKFNQSKYTEEPEIKQQGGLWTETIDKNGNSSIRLHQVKILSEGCKENNHFFEYDGNPQRDAICKHCKTISKFVVGLHTIKEGKIVTQI